MGAMLPLSCLVCGAVYSVLCVSCVTCRDRHVDRETVYGKVRGLLVTAFDDHVVEKFLGIPYAKPPLGRLRFEYPEEPTPWEEVLNVTVVPPACTQRGTLKRYIYEHVPNFNRSSEDCLFLNIHVPQTTKQKLPVFVYVHGGSNEVGMGAMFDGTVLAAYGEVVVLTFNYRLGALGFLSTGSSHLPGNYGLLDQLLLLKWVQRNIHFFNGDPTKVTIDGHSAGAADVGFHVSSAMLSYRAARPWLTGRLWTLTRAPGYDLPYFSSVLGCQHREGNRALKECLQTVSEKELQNGRIHRKRGQELYFPPNVDSYFIPDHPFQLLNNADMNGERFMLGFTRDEGARHAQVAAHRLHQRFTRESLKDRILNFSVAFPRVPGIDKLILHEYTSWEDPENTTGALLSYSEMEGDFSIVAPVMHMAAKLTRKRKPVYMYSFEYLSPNSPTLPRLGRYESGMSLGVPHGRDLFYLFGYPLVGHPFYLYTEKDIRMSELVMDTWINFIKTGEPSNDVAAMHQYDDEEGPYLKFYENGDEVTSKTFYKYKPRKMHFWNELLPSLNDLHCAGSVTARRSLLAVVLSSVFLLLLL
ncbi:hypothetical protein ScPMuIL_001402 [Solemya velum]